MAEFNINILGCGSALPTTRHLATSQIVDLRDKLYMIDCGEGTQVQMRRMRIKFSRLNHLPPTRRSLLRATGIDLYIRYVGT